MTKGIVGYHDNTGMIYCADCYGELCLSGGIPIESRETGSSEPCDRCEMIISGQLPKECRECGDAFVPETNSQDFCSVNCEIAHFGS